MIIFIIMNFETIAKYLTERRKSLAVSQRELANLSGISLHSLSNIESGRGNPTFDVLFRLCEVLGLEIGVGVKKI